MTHSDWPVEIKNRDVPDDLPNLAIDVIGTELVDGLRTEAVADLIRFVLSSEGIDHSASVNVALVDDEWMRQLHWQFLQDSSDTDVMTFPDENSDGSEELWGGEIVIAVGQAGRQANVHNNSLVSEVHYLVVHGLLHLTEWNDLNEGDRERMIQRQDELMSAWLRARKVQV